MKDDDDDIKERLAVAEATLSHHLRSCEKRHDRAFLILITVLGSVVALILKQWGII